MNKVIDFVISLSIYLSNVLYNSSKKIIKTPYNAAAWLAITVFQLQLEAQNVLHEQQL